MKRLTFTSLVFTLVIGAASLFGADIFISPAGGGNRSGSSWSNAIEGHGNYVNAAISAAKAAGATEINIYYAGGDYTITQQVSVSSLTIPLKLSGGYLAVTDGSLERGETKTVLTRHSSYRMRLFYGNNIKSLSFDGLTFKGGYLVAANASGAGLYFTTCPNVVMTNCTVTTCKTLPSNSNQNIFGGGVYSISSTIKFFDCDFTSNVCGEGGTNVKTRGAALFAQNCTILIDNCDFVDNKMRSAYNNGAWGGAIFSNGGSIKITNSRFVRNKCGNESMLAAGGALALRGMKSAILTDNYFENCYANLGAGPKYEGYSGGYLYLDDLNTSDSLMTTIVERCIFNTTDSVSILSSKCPKSKGTIVLNGGHLFVTNSLFCNLKKDTQRTATNTIYVCRTTVFKDAGDLNSGGVTPTSISEAHLVNVTIADGLGVGAGTYGSGSQLYVKNSIIYGNSVASLSAPTEVEYSCLQEEHAGVGNFVEDPLWTGNPYYHLKSRNANSYITDGYFAGSFNNEKQSGFTQSPCVDAGAPNSPNHYLEPQARGHRINLGAYGGTPWATKTFYQLGSILRLK